MLRRIFRSMVLKRPGETTFPVMSIKKAVLPFEVGRTLRYEWRARTGQMSSSGRGAKRICWVGPEELFFVLRRTNSNVLSSVSQTRLSESNFNTFLDRLFTARARRSASALASIAAILATFAWWAAPPNHGIAIAALL